MTLVAEYTPEGYYDDDWKRRAACRDDDRFISEPSDSLAADLALICCGCDVFTRCRKWAHDEQVTDVFAAGEWKESDELLESA